MNFSQPVLSLIRQRFSCRNYLEKPIAVETQQALTAFLGELDKGPLGTKVRLRLIAASEENRKDLKGLGTYGFIRGATGFLLGAVQTAEKDLEDYGYLMEAAILRATDLNLGTCWLGGTFTKSSFSHKIDLQKGEVMPAVVSVGLKAGGDTLSQSLIRRSADATHRKPWENLFFRSDFGTVLTRAEAGAFAEVLEMVRIAPSASNKQPWRIVKDETAWHFYLQRTPGYNISLPFRLLGLADIQRVDTGIAMCHFQLSAAELGLPGSWRTAEPHISKPAMTDYAVSWLE
jgi:hypothetical protein